CAAEVDRIHLSVGRARARRNGWFAGARRRREAGAEPFSTVCERRGTFWRLPWPPGGEPPSGFPLIPRPLTLCGCPELDWRCQLCTACTAPNAELALFAQCDG